MVVEFSLFFNVCPKQRHQLIPPFPFLLLTPAHAAHCSFPILISPDGGMCEDNPMVCGAPHNSAVCAFITLVRTRRTHAHAHARVQWQRHLIRGSYRICWTNNRFGGKLHIFNVLVALLCQELVGPSRALSIVATVLAASIHHWIIVVCFLQMWNRFITLLTVAVLH